MAQAAFSGMVADTTIADAILAEAVVHGRPLLVRQGAEQAGPAPAARRQRES